jgi:hypothetical protein
VVVGGLGAKSERLDQLRGVPGDRAAPRAEQTTPFTTSAAGGSGRVKAAELLRALEAIEYQLTELRGHALIDLLDGTGTMPTLFCRMSTNRVTHLNAETNKTSKTVPHSHRERQS